MAELAIAAGVTYEHPIRNNILLESLGSISIQASSRNRKYRQPTLATAEKPTC